MIFLDGEKIIYRGAILRELPANKTGKKNFAHDLLNALEQHTAGQSVRIAEGKALGCALTHH